MPIRTRVTAPALQPASSSGLAKAPERPKLMAETRANPSPTVPRRRAVVATGAMSWAKVVMTHDITRGPVICQRGIRS